MSQDKLRQMAEGLLKRDPRLATALHMDLHGRKPVGDEETGAMIQALREAGYGGGVYSMASQFRHSDWLERPPDAPKPEGRNRTFYHFTSLVHLPVVLQFGIARGDVCLAPGEEMKNFNAPWVTSDPSWGRQGWAENDDGTPNSTFDKRDVRLAVALPENDPALISWADLCEREKVEDFWRKAMHRPGEEHWFVYNARIPKTWITAVEFRHKPSLETGRFGILRDPDLFP